MVCDSNILIYAAEPGDVLCRPFVESADATIASVTRIEVLGFPRFSILSSEQQGRLHVIVASTIEVPLDDEIIRCAITLRQQRKMSLADSIIAATALEYGVPLISRNEEDFKHIVGLDLRNPFAAIS